jgi:hypothetical protein
MMADEMAAGKTFWHQHVSWIYRHELDPKTFGKTSISGVEEQLDFALEQGAPFFFVDELEGGIKSTIINAFITGGKEKTLRTAYGKFATFSTEKLMIMLAGVKGFVVDPQMASRTIPIRILKPTDPKHWETPGGISMKDWARENALRLLAGVYAVIKEWVKDGAPLADSDTRFPQWSKTINGILIHTLKLQSATQGLEELQEEISNPAIEWIAEVIPALEEEGVLWVEEGPAKWLSTNDIRIICENAGISVPGVNPQVRDENALRRTMNRQIGKIIASLPRARENNGRDPILRFGNRFLIRYSAKNRDSRPEFHFVLGRSATIPEKIEHAVISHTVDDFGNG